MKKFFFLTICLLLVLSVLSLAANATMKIPQEAIDNLHDDSQESNDLTDEEVQQLEATGLNIADAELDDFHTQLLVELTTIGHYDEPGDLFMLKARVTNVGDWPSIFTLVKLQDAPSDWILYPSHKFRYMGLIWPGQTKEAAFLAMKGETDATVYVTAKGINTLKATSESIPIPIYWGVIVGLVISIIGLTFYARKKKYL